MSYVIESNPGAVATADNSPSAMLMIAVQRGDDMERLRQLMELQERYEANEARKVYNNAFAAFKAEAVTLVKNRRVTDGPLRGKGYAELHAIVNAITPALSRHGLSASWRLTKDERDWIEVTCTLRHEVGHSESVSMGGPPDAGGAKNAIQARASTVSYLERYTLKAIVGLAEQDEDDDGAGGKEDEAKLKRGQEIKDAMFEMISLFAQGRELAALDMWRNPKHWAKDQAEHNEEKIFAWGLLKQEPKLRAFLNGNDQKANTK